MSKISAIDLIKQADRLTIGIELPLDNDWSPDGEARRIVDGRMRGVPSLSAQSDLVRSTSRRFDAAASIIWRSTCGNRRGRWPR